MRVKTACRLAHLILQGVAFLASIATAILAALSDKEQFAAWGKYLLVTLPLITSVVTSLLAQLHVHDLWKLREQGRIQMQDLALDARRRVAGATAEECKVVHKEIQDRLTAIEIAHSTASLSVLVRALVGRVQQRWQTIY